MLVSQFLAGLAAAAPLFMLASGLSLLFEATGIVNFAHGAVAALGASLAWAAVGRLSGSPGDVAMVFGGVAVATALLGVIADIVLLRRLSAAPFLLRCLGTLALSLMVGGFRVLLWNPDSLALPRAGWLGAAVEIGAFPLPIVDFVRIGAGALVVAGFVILRRAVWPRVSGPRRRTVVAAGAAGLAGLAGTLVLLDTPVDPGLDLRLLTETFVVAAIGGLGSIPGALVAALLIGQLQVWGAALLPQVTPVLLFAAMALVVAVRPGGLFGLAQADQPASPTAILPIRPTPLTIRLVGALALLLAVVAPFAVTPALLFPLALASITILFAASLQVIVGSGGMPSFGHAAFFGTGAYAAALLAPTGTTLALLAAPLAAGLFAVLVGALVARLAIPVLAMLTLVLTEAAAAIARHAVAPYAPAWLGGDSVLRNVRVSAWASEPTTLYGLVLAISVGGTLLLRRVMRAPFGYALRAVRDDPARGRSIGLSLPALRIAAFTLGGAVAGLAGGLAAFARGGVAPTDLEAGTSVDGLLALLLGGTQALSGPVIGALAYTGLAATLPTVAGASRLLLGLAVLALVLLLPEGIAGASIRQWRRGA